MEALSDGFYRQNPGEREFFHRSSELPSNPTIHLINTRIWLNDLFPDNNGTLKDIPDVVLDDLSTKYNALYLMGIYTPSNYSRDRALQYIDQYKNALPDVSPEDVCASPFAIPGYEPNSRIAHGWGEVDEFRSRLHERNMKLCLDFIPNHMGVDAEIVKLHPEYFMTLPEGKSIWRQQDRVVDIEDQHGTHHQVFHAKDPYFDEWSDTLQWNIANEETQRYLYGQLYEVLRHSDGVRCDMAHLINMGTFKKTWGEFLGDQQTPQWNYRDFWEWAIPKLKRELGEEKFFIAEAYEELDTLTRYGFDGIYDKQFCDWLAEIANNNGQGTESLVSALRKRILYNSTYPHVTFLENHDEQRAVVKFGRKQSQAALAILAAEPHTILLTHHDQNIGRGGERIPMQVDRMPPWNVDTYIAASYDMLHELRKHPVYRYGVADVFDVDSVGDASHSKIIAQAQYLEDQGFVLCTNYSNGKACGRVVLPANAHVLSVYDCETSEYLSEQIIDDRNHTNYFVKLAPWERQIIYYQLI